MVKLKSIVKDLLPPIALRVIKALARHETSFGPRYDDWGAASKVAEGYDSDEIFQAVLEASLKVKSGAAVYERDSVLFDEVDYSWPVTSALMWIAAYSGRLDVMDFGGSLGSSYFENRFFLERIPGVRWSIIEQERFVVAGRECIADDQLNFFLSIEDCLKERNPNVILLSSVLQYLPQPELIIEKIKEINADLIIIDRTIINKTENSSFYIQYVSKLIYNASYVCRSFAELDLLGLFSPNYEVGVKFQSLKFPALNKIKSDFVGYILIKKNFKA